LLTCSIFQSQRLRKIPPRGVELPKGSLQPVDNKRLTKKTGPIFSTSLDKILYSYTELQELVKVWPELPGYIKAAIEALIETGIKARQ